MDNHSCVIVGVQGTAARMSQETVAAQDMIARFAKWQGQEPASVVADATYGNGEFLQWLMERNITPYMRTRDSALRKNNPGYGPDRFTYLPESNRYLCPAGEQLNYVGLNVRNRAPAYIGNTITNPDVFFGLVPRVAEAPSGIKALQFFPSMSKDRAVCLWEANSVDALKGFLEPLSAPSSRNTYYTVDSTKAIGLPTLVAAA